MWEDAMVSEGVARQAHDVALAFHNKKAADSKAAAAAHSAAEVAPDFFCVRSEISVSQAAVKKAKDECKEASKTYAISKVACVAHTADHVKAIDAETLATIAHNNAVST